MNTGGADFFGWSVAVSGDGGIVAVGAPEENSGATGIGAEINTPAYDAGAVYLY